MLSDDDIQRVAIQCDMKTGQHWNRERMNTSKMRAFARAIKREACRQALEDAAQPDAVEALWRIIEAANGRQRHNPITDEMHAALRYARAVLAAQGGKDAE